MTEEISFSVKKFNENEYNYSINEIKNIKQLYLKNINIKQQHFRIGDKYKINILPFCKLRIEGGNWTNVFFNNQTHDNFNSIENFIYIQNVKGQMENSFNTWSTGEGLGNGVLIVSSQLTFENIYVYNGIYFLSIENTDGINNIEIEFLNGFEKIFGFEKTNYTILKSNKYIFSEKYTEYNTLNYYVNISNTKNKNRKYFKDGEEYIEYVFSIPLITMKNTKYNSFNIDKTINLMNTGNDIKLTIYNSNGEKCKLYKEFELIGEIKK